MPTVKRVIPCLDIRDGRVVKGVRFEGIRDIGDPAELAAYYVRSGADELALYDISASREGRTTMTEVVRTTAPHVTIPFVVGGGVDSIDAMSKLIGAGADKISVNSAAVRDPDLVRAGAREFGHQVIVVSVDCRRIANEPKPRWEVIIKGGHVPTGRDVVEWAKEVEGLGAAELVLNSIDADGTRDGYDNELNRAVTDAVRIPVVASGGAGCLEHLRDGFLVGHVDAVLAASIFHSREFSVKEVKEYLAGCGIPVRLVES